MSEINITGDTGSDFYEGQSNVSKPCQKCFYWPEGGTCARTGKRIRRSSWTTCNHWINGVDSLDEEQEFRIQEKCPFCEYSAECMACDSQFKERKKACRDLVGAHVLAHHPDKIAEMFVLMAGAFQAFTGATVDATRRIGRLADYARTLGSVVDKLNRDAREIVKK